MGAQDNGRGVYGNASAGGGRSLRISGCGREHGSRRMNSVTAENAVLIEWPLRRPKAVEGLSMFFFFFQLMDYGYENLLWYEEQAESNATEKPADLMWIMIVICTVLMEPGGGQKGFVCANNKLQI